MENPDKEGYSNFLKLVALNEVHYIFLRSHQIDCSDVQATAAEIHYLTQCQNSEISWELSETGLLYLKI